MHIFWKKSLGDILWQNEYGIQERGRQQIQEITELTQENNEKKYQQESCTTGLINYQPQLEQEMRGLHEE